LHDHAEKPGDEHHSEELIGVERAPRELQNATLDLDRRVMFGPSPAAARPSRLILLWVGLSTLALTLALLAGETAPSSLGAWASHVAVAGLAGAIGIVLLGLVPVVLAVGFDRANAIEQALEMLNRGSRWLGVPQAYLLPRIGILTSARQPDHARELCEAWRSHVSGPMRRELDRRLAVLWTLLEMRLIEAETILKESLIDSPDDAALRVSLGMALYHQNRYADAAEELGRVADKIAGMKGARRVSMYFALGDSLSRTGRKKDAAPWFAAAKKELQDEK